ncbi:hypothetical protein CLV42_103469 [Chitinophaga ginsengisoli]|uniref:Uncharacterized protein n=1 Tax=Chitinophaga ginsengisoli TaxID=363837 RepID=A0A2P8GHN4_9BACT|nr:hypothetical protein CLV42_103469 [Chitinophaga ginsengisoli]
MGAPRESTGAPRGGTMICMNANVVMAQRIIRNGRTPLGVPLFVARGETPGINGCPRESTGAPRGGTMICMNANVVMAQRIIRNGRTPLGVPLFVARGETPGINGCPRESTGAPRGGTMICMNANVVMAQRIIRNGRTPLGVPLFVARGETPRINGCPPGNQRVPLAAER